MSQLKSVESFSFTEKAVGQNYAEGQMAQIWTIDAFLDHYGTPCPNYIKIDVPGLTRQILVGGARTLSRPEVKQIQVEVNEQKPGGRFVAEFLTGLGFSIKHRNMKRGGTVQGDLVFAKACLVCALAVAAMLTLSLRTAFATEGEFGGECVMGLALGKDIKTDCSVNTVYEGKTYCFGNETARDLFLKKPSEFLLQAQIFYSSKPPQAD